MTSCLITRFSSLFFKLVDFGAAVISEAGADDETGSPDSVIPFMIACEEKTFGLTTLEG